MLNFILTAIAPALLVIAVIVLVAPVVLCWRWYLHRQPRHSPLTKNLLRPPGHSLHEKIEEIDGDIDIFLIYLFLTPFIAFSVHISQVHFGGKPDTVSQIAFTVACAALFGCFCGWRMFHHLKRKRIHRLGLEGELATAEELNQLMLDGCRVFHDIPYQYGNIDHVVVSRSGVYCVNTKCLGKLKEGNGDAEVVVDHDQNLLRFPDRNCPIPTSQLETEAKWLSQNLSSAVGEKVVVEPMLALPGWFIKERKGRDSVYVFNPNKPQKFFVRNRSVLTPEMVQRIAHQLEQLVRNVEPAFRESKKWKVARSATSI